jgi:protein FAM32A
MPSDEYTPAARGPLRLKGGAGVTKKKKKKSGKNSSSTDLEKNLSTGDVEAGSSGALVPAVEGGSPSGGDEVEKKSRRRGGEDGEGDGDAGERRSGEEAGEGEDGEEENKTETERRFAEAKRKRVCQCCSYPTSPFWREKVERVCTEGECANGWCRYS